MFNFKPDDGPESRRYVFPVKKRRVSVKLLLRRIWKGRWRGRSKNEPKKEL
jgi:hypothetical protein